MPVVVIGVNHRTAPLEVLEAMTPYFIEHFGNPSSISASLRNSSSV